MGSPVVHFEIGSADGAPDGNPIGLLRLNPGQGS